MLLARYASPDDMAFVSQDGYLQREMVLRKVLAGEIVVAERAAEPLGYARIEFLWSKIPYLALIRVLPEHQRQGVGRTLLGFLEAELYAAGHRMLLSSSQADEPQPLAWHRHVGFQECGRLIGVNTGGIDEVFFRMSLAPPAAPA